MKEHIPEEDKNLRELIIKISELGKRIRQGFLENQGVAGTKNIYGETQVEMDKWADQVLVDGLKDLPYVASLSSEERDDVIQCSPEGEFSITFDPLDGSSLMGINLTVGTIVGIMRSKDPFVKGADLAGGMYILYGPLTTLNYSVGNGLHEFVIDKKGDFILQEEDLRIGSKKIFSPGGLRKKWLPYHARFIEKLEEEGYKLRFAGAFVADVHQIIHKGGVFTYPAYEGGENGKLRLLFEAIPMGYLISQAGGAVSNGKEDILSVKPEKLDQRVPIYIGGKKEIDMIHEETSKEGMI